MRELLRKILTGETLRYLVFGLLTVAVNILSYRLLRLAVGTLAANTAAFFLAVFFAYFTNSLFVFHAPFTWKSFAQFFLMRAGMIIIDDGGMLLLIRWGWDELLAKCVVNALIIVLNYLFSKLFIFRKKEKEGQSG